jgi:hypothetical protein
MYSRSNNKHKNYTNKKTNKINKTKKKFVKLNCSPTNKNKLRHYTCYEDADLMKLKNVWNSRHSDTKIESDDPKVIWDMLKQYYSKTCDRESCWIKDLVRGTRLEKELMDSFAPQSPNEWKKNPNQWLSSVDILEVMGQYEKKYKCFEFMGPSPIDYDTVPDVNSKCVWPELCGFNLSEQINKKKTKIGIIFNLDPHDKGGSHWVSLFVNIKRKTIFYYDSAGDDIPKQIMNLVNTITDQGRNLLTTPFSFRFDKNYPVEHQKGNTECGMYSLFFIIHMLEDKLTTKYLKRHTFDDKYIEQFRKIYFNDDL